MDTKRVGFSELVERRAVALQPVRLGVPLAPGQYYLVGVGVAGTHGIAVPEETALPLPVSFGQVLGGYTLTLECGEAAIPGTIRIGAGEVGAGVGLRVGTETL